MLNAAMLYTLYKALANAQTQRDLTQNDWKFTLDSIATEYSDKGLQRCRLADRIGAPRLGNNHGTSTAKYDRRSVAVTQNGEKVASYERKPATEEACSYIGTG